MRFLTAASCVILAGSIASAVAGQITYVDATPLNTTLADGTPLVLVPSSPANPQDYTSSTAEDTADHHWHVRNGFANGGQVWNSTAGAAPHANDCPTLRTTLTGLTPGESYDVHAFFWVAGFNTWPTPGGSPASNNVWDLRAGATPDSMANFSLSIAGTSTNMEGRAGDFTTTVLTAEGNRRLFRADLGTLTADSAGKIPVFIDDFPGNDDRTWYDGVGYQTPAGPPVEPPAGAEGVRQIAADGAWTWFNDERAIYHQGKLFAGYVLGDGRYGVTRHDPATGTSDDMIISTAASQQKDDHNNPSLTVLPDGRLLAVYSKHGAEAKYYYRSSKVPSPATDADWNAEQSKATPAASTYANTFRLSAEAGRIFNFHRCINYNPTLTLSTDDGSTWGTPVQLISSGSGTVRPYVRYCSNLTDRIDLIHTDGHPRDINNSIYHLYYRAGNLHRTDGTVIDSLANLPLDHDGGERGTVVYPYTAAAWGPGEGPDDWIPGGRAWTWDVHYGPAGRPVCVFQVQRDNVTGSGWNHDRIYYYHARWTGTEWQRRFIAQGGRPLYSAEDDYGGGMCIDPEDTRVIYIATNAANPFALGDLDNVPLAANDRYEIWRGFTADGGLTFSWTPVTQDSTADNLRPIVPPDHGRAESVLWFQGTYSTYTNFSARVMGKLSAPVLSYSAWALKRGLAADSGAEDEDRDGDPNFLEYASGSDPGSAASRADAAWTGAAFEFPVIDERSDAEWHVERSDDLEEWTTIATVRAGDLPDEVEPGNVLSATAVPGRMRLTPAEAGGSRIFYRLRALPHD